MAEETKTRHLHAPLMGEKEDIEKEEKSNVESRYGSLTTKILFTVFIYMVYVVHGMNGTILGPSLIDLEYLTNSSTSSIATVFTWKYGGYLLGTIVAGPIVDRLDEFLVIGVALSSLAAAAFLTPTWRQLLGLFITSGGSGIASACNSVCTSATILAIWGKDAKSYLQGLHFAAAIGWALAPQMIKPFLRLTTREGNNRYVISNNVDNQTLEYENVTMVSLRYINGSLISQEEMSSESYIQYCYIIIASCLMLLSLSSFVIVICSGCKLRKKPYKHSCGDKGKSVVDGKVRVIILILLFWQAFMYGGIELTFMSFTMTFVVKYIKMSKPLGSDISSLFTAMIATSRVLSILLSRFIQPSTLLVMQLATLLSGTLVIAFAVKLHWIVPWIGFAAAGLGTGSLFPTLMSWANGYMTVKGKEAAILFSGAGLTAMTVPPLVGFLFEKINPMWFAYITLILIGLFILLYLANLLIIQSLLKVKEQELKENSEEPVKGPDECRKQ